MLAVVAESYRLLATDPPLAALNRRCPKVVRILLVFDLCFHLLNVALQFLAKRSMHDRANRHTENAVSNKR